MSRTTMPGYEVLERDIFINLSNYNGIISHYNTNGCIIRTSYSCGHTREHSVSIHKLSRYLPSDGYCGCSVELRNWSKVLVVNNYHKGSCPDCYIPPHDNAQETISGERIYCDSMPRPRGFKNMELFHGLYAYCSRDHIVSESSYAFDNFLGIYDHSEWQICCSTSAIGNIGLVVTGDVITASNIDLYTRVDEEGRRYYTKTSHQDDRATRGIIMSASELCTFRNTHSEMVVQNTCIKAVWVQSNASDDVILTAEHIAEEYNIELRFI